MTKSSPWVASDACRKSNCLRLFCFPYAGAGASCFRRLLTLLPPAVDAVPVRLPGREERLGDEPYHEMDPLVDAAAEALEPLIRGRCAFLGYSLGALVAYEVARALQWQARPLERLLVAACGGPSTFAPIRADRRPEYTDEALLRRLREHGATPQRLLEEPEAMAVLMPAVRADFRVLDNYRAEATPRLKCPIHVFGGLLDSGAPLEELNAWRLCTTSATRVVQLHGGHFFIHSDLEGFAAALSGALGVGDNAALGSGFDVSRL